MFPPQPDSAQWTFERQGRRFGPVSTQTIESLCRAGVIVPGTGVNSTLFNRWVLAATVPALRPWLASPANASPAALEELLRNIPSTSASADDFNTKPCGLAMFPVTAGGTKWVCQLLLLGTVIVGALQYFALTDVPRPMRIGASIGVAVFPFGVGLVVGYLLSWLGYLVGGFSRRAANVCFSIGACLVAGWTLLACVASYHTHHAAGPAVQQANRDLNAVYQQLHAYNLTTKPMPKLELSKDNASLVALTRALGQEAGDSRMRYLSTCRAAHVDRMLSMQNLTDRASYAASRANCQAVYGALRTLDKEQRSIITGVAARVQACDASELAKKDFLIGFNQSRAIEERFLAENIELEGQQMDEIVAVLDLTEPYAPQLAIVNGRLRFPRTDLANAYNDHLRRLHNIAGTEKDMLAQHEKEVEQRLDRLATLAPE